MNKRKLLMKKNSWIIFLLLFGITGCTSQSNKQKQEDVARKDTAYVIKSFLREGITYICKDPIMKSYLIDYSYSPPQKYELNQITAKIQGNKVVVGTDNYTTHTIKSGTFWRIEEQGNTPSSSRTNLAILETDKGEVRIAEVDGVLEDFCVLDIIYGHYKASTNYSLIYCWLPQERISQYAR